MNFVKNYMGFNFVVNIVYVMQWFCFFKTIQYTTSATYCLSFFI